MSLLSLKDFNNYLENHARSSHQKISLKTKTWVFGSEYSCINEKKTAKDSEGNDEIMNSILSITGSSGSTDDGACLNAIYESISRVDKKKIRSGQKIVMIFEITDGASSFPGTTMKVVDKIINEGILLYAFQIGENTLQETKIFDAIWNPSLMNQRGIHVGQKLDDLPKLLMETVSKNLEVIFTK